MVPEALVLASGSPRRRELLARMGLEFQVVVADVEEHADLAGKSPEAFVLSNSWLKGQWVSDQRPQDLVLAADTTVLLGEEILNKPDSLEDARTMLGRLSGRPHTVITGVTLLHAEGNLNGEGVVYSEVVFKDLTEQTIEAYMASVNPLDKAGGYGIQEGREMIIREFRGSYSNIMGLPVEWLERKLEALNLLDLFRGNRVQ